MWTERVKWHAANVRRAATVKEQRPVVGRSYAFDAIRRVAPYVVGDDGTYRFLLATNDRNLGRTTFAEGAYELDVMNTALDLVAASLRHDPVRGRTFVDVGANVGTTSIPAVKDRGAERVIAIEPSPENFRLLRCNVILNEVEDRVDCVNVAVTRDEGTVELELSPRNSGDHRVRVTGERGAYGEEERTVVAVPAAPLDDVLADREVDSADVGVAWIDTQGHEGHVLASAPRLLHARPHVVIEYWPYGLRRSGGLDLLHETITASFACALDVREGGRRIASERIAELADVYADRRQYTDLVLVPR